MGIDFMKIIKIEDEYKFKGREANPDDCISIEDIYKFRTLNREVYDKAELLADLTGTLFKVRDVKGINKMSIDLSQYSISIEDSNEKKVSAAIVEIENILVSFLRRFSYLSSLDTESADKYEYFLDHFSVMDVIKCGNSATMTL